MQPTGELRAFEGLVFSTARMFAAQVGREEEDLAQELRVRVWRAIATYDPARSTQSLERYVFSAVANKIKDFKRDRAREVERQRANGLTFLHIEDMVLDRRSGSQRRSQQEAFDGLFYYATRDEVYGHVDEGLLTLPNTVTEREAEVTVLLMLGVTRIGVVQRLGPGPPDVDACVRSLRRKMADWKPPGDSRTVVLAEMVA
jgi:DNA-directed RNA polymerase specialized sigma24 family protein